jgi:hypothetical protein
MSDSIGAVASQERRHRRIITILCWPLGCFVIVLAILGYGYWRFESDTRPSPETTFNHYFKTPISNISDLSGDGYAWLDYKVWIRFKCSEPVVLKQQAEYVKVAPSSNTRTALVEQFPNDAQALAQDADIECIERKTSSDNDSFWHNKRRGIYWFLAW